MPKNPDRPQIGLALSGGSGKAIAHIGVLEVLREARIPIDYIVGCSSGTIVAGSFACGTMEEMKQDWLRMDRKFLFNMFELDRSGKAILSGNKAIRWVRNYLLDKNFEDVNPRLGFTSVDVLTGESVLLSMGSMLKAAQASCATPGLVEPVPWGNKLLVDGGLYSLVPTSQAKEMGADIVIGVNIASTPYAFTRKAEAMRQFYNFLRKSLPVKMYIKVHGWLDKLFTLSFNFLTYNQSDMLAEAEAVKDPGVLAVLGRAMDISMQQRKRLKGLIPDCDCLIVPKLKHVGKIDTQDAASMLEEGRRAARAAIPEIQQLIKDYQWRLGHARK